MLNEITALIQPYFVINLTIVLLHPARRLLSCRKNCEFITQEPADLTVFAGERARFNCSIQNLDLDGVIVWTFDGIATGQWPDDGKEYSRLFHITAMEQG